MELVNFISTKRTNRLIKCDFKGRKKSWLHKKYLKMYILQNLKKLMN